MITEGRDHASQDVAHSHRSVLPRTLENLQEHKELMDDQDTKETLPDEWSDNQKPGYKSRELE